MSQTYNHNHNIQFHKLLTGLLLIIIVSWGCRLGSGPGPDKANSASPAEIQATHTPTLDLAQPPSTEQIVPTATATIVVPPTATSTAVVTTEIVEEVQADQSTAGEAVISTTATDSGQTPSSSVSEDDTLGDEIEALLQQLDEETQAAETP